MRRPADERFVFLSYGKYHTIFPGKAQGTLDKSAGKFYHRGRTQKGVGAVEARRAIEIQYQDGALLVCVKPAGVPSEGTEEGALPVLLSRQTGGPAFPVHRLDQAASGLMVLARSRGAAAALSDAMASGGVRKEYFALISGAPEPPEGRMEDLLFKDARRGKVFVVKSLRKGVRPAALTYRVLQRQGEISLVRAALETGRTHQIRVQFASRGMPLLGDGKYGSRIKGGLMLWSCRLVFPHPAGGRRMAFYRAPDWAGWRFPAE